MKRKNFSQTVKKVQKLLKLNDNRRELFIDSFSSEDEVGYVISNEIMINSLLEVFENVYKNIKDERIKVYK